jgi:hypothetical protein
MLFGDQGRVCPGLAMLALLAVAVSPASAIQPGSPEGVGPQLVGVASIAGTATDFSGLTDQLGDGTPHNQWGGVSAIDWIPGTDRYLVASDRGPKDGAVEYCCRWHEIEIIAKTGSGSAVVARPISTSLLRDASRRILSGSSAALSAEETRGSRFDPEGLRIAGNGLVWVSDEYGPRVVAFDRAGDWQREFALPAEFRIGFPSSDPKYEDAHNCRGRRSNRGLEGLALTPDGRYLVGLMQSALLQDARRDEAGKPVGWHARLLRIDLETGEQQQFVYRQAAESHKLHEILALDNERFLVIEQDGLGGEAAVYKKIIAIDLRSATPVDAVCRLPADELPASIQPVARADFLDLLAPRFGLTGPALPEKIEGLSWGPALPNGQRMLVVATDNDFRAEQDSLFLVFSVADQDRGTITSAPPPASQGHGP